MQGMYRSKLCALCAAITTLSSLAAKSNAAIYYFDSDPATAGLQGINANTTINASDVRWTTDSSGADPLQLNSWSGHNIGAADTIVVDRTIWGGATPNNSNLYLAFTATVSSVRMLGVNNGTGRLGVSGAGNTISTATINLNPGAGASDLFSFTPSATSSAVTTFHGAFAINNLAGGATAAHFTLGANNAGRYNATTLVSAAITANAGTRLVLSNTASGGAAPVIDDQSNLDVILNGGWLSNHSTSTPAGDRRIAIKSLSGSGTIGNSLSTSASYTLIRTANLDPAGVIGAVASTSTTGAIELDISTQVNSGGLKWALGTDLVGGSGTDEDFTLNVGTLTLSDFTFSGLAAGTYNLFEYQTLTGTVDTTLAPNYLGSGFDAKLDVSAPFVTLTLTAIPEPTTAFGLMTVAAITLARRRASL